MEETMKIGQYAVPWVLSIVLAFIYSQMSLTDKVKNRIAVLCGIVFGLIVIWVNPTTEKWIAQNIIEHVLYGFNAGLTAVGFWKTLNINVNIPGRATPPAS